MSVKITTNLRDRSTWGQGPWEEEPEDRIAWIDEATGLDCLMIRAGLGAWCGYVAVPEGHPDYNMHYDGVDVQVHGGLTYSAPCDGDPEEGICHVKKPGEKEVWWLGFDTAHAGDMVPGMKAYYAQRYGQYRTTEYVRGQVERLAQQLAERR